MFIPQLWLPKQEQQLSQQDRQAGTGSHRRHWLFRKVLVVARTAAMQKVQAALPSFKLLLLMRALYSNPFLGKAYCERNEVNFVKSYCGRVITVLLKPMSG